MGIFDWFKKDRDIKNGNEDDIYSHYTKANSHFDNKDFPLSVDHFNKVIDLLLQKDLPLEILSTTAFTSEDMSVTFTLIDLYHLRGCAKFNMSDVSSIDDFTESIKIHKNYEDAYYMRGSSYFILLEDWQKAITDIKKYLTFSPDDKAGNQLLIVLEEIKKNSLQVSKLYNKGVSEYSEAEKIINNSDEEAVVHLNKSKENLEKALDLYSQKNRVYIYQKSHSFSLCDIYFKILQCNLQLGGINASDGNFSHDDANNPMTECIHIYKISKGKFKPDKSVLGANLYYTILDKAKDIKNNI